MVYIHNSRFWDYTTLSNLSMLDMSHLLLSIDVYCFATATAALLLRIYKLFLSVCMCDVVGISITLNADPTEATGSSIGW